MAGIDPKEFMDELHFCINEQDIIKAKALLQFASDQDMDFSIQQKALFTLGKAPDAIAFPLLEHLLKIQISNPGVNEALYELILDKSYGRTDLVIRYINHEHKKSRLFFVQAAGDLMLKEAAPDLARILDQEKDREILLAATKALGALRLDQYLPNLALVQKNSDVAIRNAAIFAMAEMGNKAAIDTLFSTITDPENTDESRLVAIEALAGIQNQLALDCLARLLESPHADTRDAAIDQLIAIGNKAVPTLTMATRNAGVDHTIHLVTTLGYIGDPSALPTLLDMINVQPNDANIRQALYEALAKIPSVKSAICLTGGLSDSVEAVRMSAARAVDKNLSKVLVAGLKNIVRQEDKTACDAVAALIDTEADSIFNFLLDEASFVRLAADHVINKADPATRHHFMDLLRSKNREALAADMEDKIQANDARTGKRGLEVYVVDDSRMMLKLYQNKLLKFGHHPTVFEFPEKAIAAISALKPDIFITDLNMPKINGIQLTREIRRKYTRQQLPIIMITTQSDFIEVEKGSHHASVNDDYLIQSGINRLMHKPFTDEQLETAIQAVIN
ncbi:putative signal transduction protein [Desulforapulum autotrophicum HRM2]|uniref:Signal transduction protein n=1 Tax=Desulforapulum autotrophicum (strain ATCC 43914 / DSM 3382 / VKM B-1955 / HRM2) TaxID=177437 RepID=C0Q9Z5_DESAH|nr:response regulator [Desulforapulum autotrophicum]ACN16713.1 putative signal transduction protein [Desulforapulum autotrophicum HRM2]